MRGSVAMFRLLSFCFLCIGTTQANPLDSLRLVHVVFRHGDRGPEGTFPTNPNQEDAWPQGFGQLSQVGMRQEYKIGKLLRRYYNGFLNSTYIRHEVRAQSTEYDRTIMSSQALLSALYPPSGHQVWNEDIAWQPIPVHTVPKSMDRVLYMEYPCPRYNELGEGAMAREEIQKFINDSKEMLDTIYMKAGVDGHAPDPLAPMADIYESFFCETQHNMTLADWVTPEIYDFAMEVKELRLNLKVYSDEMIKLRGGRWVYETLAQMRNYTLGNLDPRMKIFLYGAHDVSISAYLSALKVFDYQNPPYSSFIMLELHESKQGSHFVRMLYKNDTNKDFDNAPRLLEFPGCPDPCSLADYERFVSPMSISSDVEHEHLCAVYSHAALFQGFHLQILVLTAIIWAVI